MGDLRAALRIYDQATNYIASAGLTREVERHYEANFEQFSESDLLREAAWVILCSGFREAAVRRVFDHISLCFCDWESARAIVDAYPSCNIAARASFNSEAKIGAIFEIAQLIHDQGFESVRAAIATDPIQKLMGFPFIGPITVWHLAKNLGLNVAKPDRHLVRISTALGFSSPMKFCNVIAQERGDPVRVVDLIIWRYMADNPMEFRCLRPIRARLSKRGHAARAQQMVRTRSISHGELSGKRDDL